MWLRDALALNHHFVALRLHRRGATVLSDDVFKRCAALILDDVGVEVEGVDLEEALPQHLHDLAVAAHLLHALFFQQHLCDALKVAVPDCMSQLALVNATGDK